MISRTRVLPTPPTLSSPLREENIQKKRRYGFLDLATANFTSRDISLLVSDGWGGFTTQQPMSVGRCPVSLVGGEFQSGQLWIAVACFLSGDATFLARDQNDHYRALESFSIVERPTCLSADDYNQDGRLDLSILGADPTLRIMLNEGGGTFRPMK